MGLTAIAMGVVLQSGNSYVSGYNALLNNPVAELYSNDGLYFSPSGGVQRSKLSVHMSGLNNDLYKINQKHQVSIKGVIDNICSALSLGKDVLASLCDVTRQTVYNWVEKPDSLKPSTAERLFQLNVAATEWKQAGYTVKRSQLNIPLVSGSSLIDILQEKPLDREKLMFAGSRMNLVDLIADDLADPFA